MKNILKTSLNKEDIKTLDKVRICAAHGCNKVEEGEDVIGQWTIDALESIGAILQYIIYGDESVSIDDELERLDKLTAY